MTPGVGLGVGKSMMLVGASDSASGTAKLLMMASVSGFVFYERDAQRKTA